MKIIDLGIEMSEQEYRKVLGVIADTDPHLYIVEDIEMYLSGLKPELNEETVKFLMGNKEGIENILNFLRMDD